jgi:hypothetical protein
VIVGALLLVGMAAFLAHAFLGTPEWPAAVGVWAAAVGAWDRVDGPTRRLTGLLLAAGAVAETVAVARGASLDPVAMAVINLPIVGLFIGVAFLSLVGAGRAAPAVEAADPAPSPAPVRDGLWPTAASIHLLGAVINMSMAAIAGDRMARDGRLARREAVLLARCYCAAAFWSPFFVAAAVAHTYAPGADPRLTIPLGIAGAVVALGLTAREVRGLAPGTPFPGFRPDARALVLTGVLLILVLAGKAVFPALPMVVIVTAVTPPVALALMRRDDRAGAVGRLLGTTLPATSGQVVLFLAAGVFAHGIASALSGIDGLADAGFAPGPWLYPLVTATLVAAAYGGAPRSRACCCPSAPIRRCCPSPSSPAGPWARRWRPCRA